MEFKKITEYNLDECISLNPKKEQLAFVASNISSLAEAYVAISNEMCVPMPFCIYEKEQMVGFIMLAYENESQGEHGNVYWVWRLMIEDKYQGLGYGKKAMEKAIEIVKSFPCGSSQFLYLSYEPNNLIAESLYSSLGFVKTGEIEEGEIVCRLQLS